MVTCAEEGDHAVQGAVFRPVEAERADRVHLEFHGGWERGVIPDGVDDDVGDRIERAVAVAGREQAAVEAGAELAGRQPGKHKQVPSGTSRVQLFGRISPKFRCFFRFR